LLLGRKGKARRRLNRGVILAIVMAVSTETARRGEPVRTSLPPRTPVTLFFRRKELPPSIMKLRIDNYGPGDVKVEEVTVLAGTSLIYVSDAQSIKAGSDKKAEIEVAVVP
jgi:hypothetical protein